jgi:signal transduction histidine kinase
MSDRNMKVLVAEGNEAHAGLVVDSFDEQHGGRITVESVSGQGSAFTSLLPLAKNNE